MANSSPLAVSKRSGSYWRATFDNPPLNLIDPGTIVALRELMDTLEADPAVKVVVFDSADEEYFIAHFDVARGGELPGPGSTRFLAGDDPRMKATIDATAQRLADKRGLVYRYTWPRTAWRVRRARSCCARSGWRRRRHSRARSRRPPVTFERAVASHSARC